MRTERLARVPARVTGVERTRYWRWEDAGGLVALAVAAALWVAVLAGVAEPLGGALAAIEAGETPAVAQAPCPTPGEALALATRPPDTACR